MLWLGRSSLPATSSFCGGIMDLLISYFYQIRFFDTNMIPLSTAVWDPKWFHDFKGQNNIFVDKRGIINGIRYAPFRPGKQLDYLCRGPENCNPPVPDKCAFLQGYYEQLMQLDYAEIQNDFDYIVNSIKQCDISIGDNPTMVLIVHEAPNNPCSERQAIIRWAKDRGIDIREFKK